MTRDRRIKLMTALLGIVAPVLITAVAVGLVFSWWDELPEIVATHWTSKAPDGFSAKWWVPWMMAGIAGVVPMLAGLALYFVLATGRRDPAYRFQVALIPGFSLFIVILITGSLHIQRGLVDATQAGPITGYAGVGLVVAVVVTALAWVVQPKQERGHAVVETEPLPLAPTETAVWTAEVRSAPVLLWVVAMGIVVSAAASTRLLVDGVMVPGLVMAGTALVLGVVTFGYERARVIVDGRGLTVRPALGWPVYRVPLEEVAKVEARDVSGVAEFGGYGFRWIPGAFGIILRGGEAISVTRRDGRRFVITVDDAATGASLLRALAERR